MAMASLFSFAKILESRWNRRLMKLFFSIYNTDRVSIASAPEHKYWALNLGSRWFLKLVNWSTVCGPYSVSNARNI